MPFDPTDMFSPQPRAVRVSAELIAYYTAKAHAQRSHAFGDAMHRAWRAVKRFSCWFRRPSADVALRGGCD
jgi:hypothetical protein